MASQMSSGLVATAKKLMQPLAKKGVLSMADFSWPEVCSVLSLAETMKAGPDEFRSTLRNQSLVMMFEKPSLRTRLSFELGMTQLGGSAIFYSLADSPLGKKESIEDTAKVISGYADIVMARLNSRDMLRSLAEHSTIPVINALDDYGHPCQVLADLLTLKENLGALNGRKLAFVGDCRNNVTYDLCRAAALGGFEIAVASPVDDDFMLEDGIQQECSKLGPGRVTVTHDAFDAVRGADAVLTDTWLSYHLNESEMESRFHRLSPFRVTSELMAAASPKALFMHCMPAQRGVEVNADVIDGPQSVIFQQAENRLHVQKALMAKLLS